MLILVDFDTVLEGKGDEAVTGFTALAAKMAADETNHIIIYTAATAINSIETWLKNDYKVQFTDAQISLNALGQNLADDQIVNEAIVFTGADLSYLPESNGRYTVVTTFDALDAAIAPQAVVEDELTPPAAPPSTAPELTDVVPPAAPESKDAPEPPASSSSTPAILSAEEQELAEAEAAAQAAEAAEQAAEAVRLAAIQAAAVKKQEAQAKAEVLRQKAAATNAAREAQAKAEQDRLAAEQAELARLAAEQAEQARLAAEQAELARKVAEAAAALTAAQDELTAAQTEVTALDTDEARLLAELTQVRARQALATERVRAAMNALHQLDGSSAAPLPPTTTSPRADSPKEKAATGRASDASNDTLPPVESLPDQFLKSKSSPSAPQVGQAEYDAMVAALTQLDKDIISGQTPEVTAQNTKLKEAFRKAYEQQIQAMWEDLIRYEQTLSPVPAVRLFDLALSTALALPLGLTLAEIPAGSLEKFGTDRTITNLKAATLPLNLIAQVILDTATAKYPDASVAAAKAEWLQKCITNTELGLLLEECELITAEIKRLTPPSAPVSSWWHNLGFGGAATTSVSTSAQTPANTSGAAVTTDATVDASAQTPANTSSAAVATKSSRWTDIFGGNKPTKPEQARTDLDENFDLATGVHYDAATKKYTKMTPDELTASQNNRDTAIPGLIKALIQLSSAVFEPKAETAEMTTATRDKLRRLPDEYRSLFADTAIKMAKEVAAAKHNDASSAYHKEVKFMLEASLGIKRTKDSGADKDPNHTISTETAPTFFGLALGNHRELIMAEINLQRKLQFIAKNRYVVASPANDGAVSSTQHTAAASASASPDASAPAAEAPIATPAGFVTEQINKFKDLVNRKLDLLEAHKPGFLSKNIDDMKMEIEALRKLVSELDSKQAELAQPTTAVEQETLQAMLANVVTRVKETRNAKRSMRAGKDVFYSTGFEKHGAGRLVSTSKGEEYINNMLEAARALQQEIDRAKAIAEAAAKTPPAQTAPTAAASPLSGWQ